MASRGVKSPDRADAVIGAFSHGVMNFAAYVGRKTDPWERLEEAYDGAFERDRLRDPGLQRQLEGLGAWTGD
jgi:hypothetical protein